MSLYNFEQIEFGKKDPFKAFIRSIDTSSFHWHYEYEIIFILKGSLTVCTNPKPVTLRVGDVLLLNPKTVHSLKHTDEDNMCLIVQLNPRLFTVEDEEDAKYHFYLNSVKPPIPTTLDYGKFTSLAARFMLMKEERDIKYAHRRRALVYEMIAELFEHVPYDVNYHTKLSTDDATTILEIVEFVENNLHKDDVLEQLSDKIGLSPKTIYRFLKDNIGLTAKELIDQMRVDKAKRLLKYSDKSIGYIGDICGFGSESTFYRVFRQKVGYTASQYRKLGLDVEENPEIQGYLNYQNKEATSLLVQILEENNHERR